jgi:ribonuclease P protein component
MADFLFKKKERLCNQKDFDNLFLHGKVIYIYPIKAVFLKSNSAEQSETRVAFGATKKTHKKATNRNKIKRLLREGYRKNKNCLSPDVDCVLNIMFIYTSKVILNYSSVEASLIKILNEISSFHRPGE